MTLVSTIAILAVSVSAQMPAARAGGNMAAQAGGRVIDERTGAPVAGAEVAVIGTPGVVRTDAHGVFTWTTAPLTPAVIVVTFSDGRVSGPIRVAAIAPGTPLVIAAGPAVRETMTVTGVSSAIDATEGAALIRMGAGDLALRHPATLVQALEAVPGVGSIAEGQSAVPAIRGLARGRTLILVDGARATSERRAGANAAFVDPAALRSVEVARGPGSVAYGSDAFGGVIALQLEGPDRGRGWHGRAAGSMGAGVPEQRGSVDLSRGYGSGAVSLGIHAREFDDYSSPFAVVPNSAWRDQGARAAWDQHIGTSRLAVRWQSDLGRDLGRPRSDSDAMLVTSPVDDSHRLTVSWQRASAGAWRSLRVDALFGAATQQTDQDRLATSSPPRPRNLESSETTYRDLQLRAVAERAIGSARVQTGVDIQGRYGLRTIDTVTAFNLAGAETSSTSTFSIDEANRTGAGAFVDATIPILSRLEASLGGRVDTVRNENLGGFWGDRSISNTAFAGVASLTAAPAGGLTITAQVARGFRDPTLTDRFYRGPVGRGIVEGNPELTPETSLQMDLTARVTAGRLRAELSAYHYRITDLVERYTVNASLFRYRNRGDARFRGIEATAAFALPRGFAVDLTAQTSRGEDGIDGTPLDDVAPASISFTARHAAGTRVSSYVRFAAYRPHEAAGPSEVATPGYEITDAGLSWHISPRLSIYGQVRNLFDEAYYGSSGPRWVYAAGRAGVATLQIQF
jgi:outer membrane receptor protein involved in Fe transport